MVDLKEAVRRAKEYAVQVLELDPGEMLLEEVRPSNELWSITLSFNSRKGVKTSGPLADQMRQFRPYDDDREFKLFQINKNTGDVEGMFNVQTA